MTTNLLTRPAARTEARLWTPRDLEILDAATRREFIAMLGAAGLLAACGNGGDAGDPAAAAPSTRRIEHSLGVADVPTDPKRVVALNITAADPVLTLGVPAVVVPDALPPVLEPLAEGIDRTSAEVNLEQVALLEPNLILCAGTNHAASAALVRPRPPSHPGWSPSGQAVGDPAAHAAVLADDGLRSQLGRASEVARGWFASYP